MDQDRFRQTYREMNERACLFEKSILSGRCSCSQSSRFCLAEREGVHCVSDQAQTQCDELLELLRHHARFTLKLNDASTVLPHGKAIRLQIGGLNGLFVSVTHTSQPPASISDIHGLISQAIEAFGALDKLPFNEIIKQVAAYKGRRER